MSGHSSKSKQSPSGAGLTPCAQEACKTSYKDDGHSLCFDHRPCPRTRTGGNVFSDLACGCCQAWSTKRVAEFSKGQLARARKRKASPSPSSKFGPKDRPKIKITDLSQRVNPEPIPTTVRPPPGFEGIPADQQSLWIPPPAPKSPPGAKHLKELAERKKKVLSLPQYWETRPTPTVVAMSVEKPPSSGGKIGDIPLPTGQQVQETPLGSTPPPNFHL